MARSWGIWSQYKLTLLERYLDAFSTASKSRPVLVYLDLFSGQPDNIARSTSEPIDGSARIALDTSDAAFTHLRFFELPPIAANLRAAIDEEYAERNALVYEGDCNQTIHEALAQLRAENLHWEPTFAFIDPNGPHYRWATLEALARHKPPGRTKVELWMLFPDPLFARLLPTTGEVRPRDNEVITAMFGTPLWHAIWRAKLDNDISPPEARTEYVDLMRWRLEQVLGYQWTFQLEVCTDRGIPIYHMLFATDHRGGRNIMKWLYETAVSEYPAMVQAERARTQRMDREAVGVYDLFSGHGIDIPLGGPQAARTTLPTEPVSEPRSHDDATCPYCH